MLNLPDFKEKQILFIRTDRKCENKIKFWNDNIRFYKDGALIDQDSCYKVFAIFIIGDISITTFLINKCQKYGISIFLLDYKFQEYASILAETEGNYILRSIQYNYPDSLNIAKSIIKNKINNQIRLLKEKRIDSAKLGKYYGKIDSVPDDKKLLGVEGIASKYFFKNYFSEIGWKRRAPQTRFDIPNFLLDIGYYYLFNYIDSLLRLFGFDTYKGFYHKAFYLRKSLACDLMEPFRCLIDKQLKKAYRLKIININDFKLINGKYALDSDNSIKYGRLFTEAIINHKEEVYKYIRGFYYHILNNEKVLPFFMINERK